nr:hypothetical protein [uncultured Sphingomonas sp.]
MTFEAALARRLLDAGVVGTRVNWLRRPQDDGYPAITLQTISDPRPEHFKGVQRLRPTRVQIDLWDTDYLRSIGLREQVLAAVVPATVIGSVRFRRAQDVTVRSLREDLPAGGDLYRELIDINFWHSA